MSKSALGRGLGALLAGAGTPVRPALADLPTQLNPLADAANSGGEQVRLIPLHQIQPCALQPRKDFTPEALQELADSIREKGIVQPLIVRPRSGRYELIAGERRWRAAQMAGLSQVPALVRDADDRAVLELALVENLQRENLNAIEEAAGYSQLMDQFQLTQEEIAAKVGKNRATVANALRLLKLAPELQTYVREGRLSVGHAKVLLGLESREAQLRAGGQVVKDGMSVRQTEDLIARLAGARTVGGTEGAAKAAPIRDAHVQDLENRLQQRLGTKVQLRYRQGKGALEIRFYSNDDLDRILEIIGMRAN